MSASMSCAMNQGPLLVIGAYSAPDSCGLEIYDFNTVDGSAAIRFELPVPNASFAIRPASRVLYAVTETGPETSGVTAFREVEDGYEVINRVSVNGDSPCHIAVSPDGRFVVTANYGDGTVTVFPVLESGGLGEVCQRLRFNGHGPVERRQAGSHPHFIHFSRDGRHMFVNDLGTDRIHKFRISDNKKFLVDESPEEDIVIKPGSGPRHIVYDRNNTFAYLINEISDQVCVMAGTDTTLVPLRYYDSPMGGGHGAGDIQLSEDGTRLYASLRLQNDGISIFDVDPATGTLSLRRHILTGGHPRTFTFSPDGRWLFVACRDAHGVEIYSVDEDGNLAYHSFIPAIRPAFVRFL